MSEILFLVPETQHNRLVTAAFRKRGYAEDEIGDITRLCADAARHGIRTHNAIKAYHLETLFGSAVGGCVPNASIEELPSRFELTQVWNAHKKIGPPVAYRAIESCIRAANRFGIGCVSVDNAWHYFWGGGYVLEAARRGYIAYTNCTAMLAEVVPYGGKTPTLGTNPHSWAFPTTESIGYPVLVDFATSSIAMGRVQQLQREGKKLLPGSAVDSSGAMTEDPAAVAALLPFGGHKGYGLGLIDELFAAYIGGSLPTVRGRFQKDGEKHSCCFFFLVLHPLALSAQSYARDRTVDENVRAILEDVLGHGNDGAILPGKPEATMAAKSTESGGLLFKLAEIGEFNKIATDCGEPEWRPEELKQVAV